MSHLPTIITDLSMILLVAGITTILFKKINQPLVLGYIVAGFITGPNFNFFPTIADSTNINAWSEIGVIFLLFALGLEFSFYKLKSVGGTAGIATAVEIGGMLLVGYAAGSLLGWNHMDSLFLGGMLAMSSTTIIIKAFDDLKMRAQRFTEVVFGILIVEDIAGIIMMVLLATLAVATTNVSSLELLLSIGRLVFFLVLWFVLGMYLVPSFFKWAQRLMNDETLVIVAIGLCLGMVVLATHLGFSSALGAFIMGSLIAEAPNAEKIEHLIAPIKDLFGAVFFVSVGMLVNPALLLEQALPIFVLVVATIIGKLIFSTLGVLASGKSLSTSIHCGFSLAQIGEFSFIIASLGMSLGVISNFLYPIIVAVSVITTFTTPFCITAAEPAYNKLVSILPNRVVSWLNRYTDNDESTGKDKDWKNLLYIYVMRMMIFSTLLLAVAIGSSMYLQPYLANTLKLPYANIITAALTLIIMAPILRAVLINRAGNADLFSKLWFKKRANHLPLLILLFGKMLIASAAIYFIFNTILGLHGLLACLGVLIVGYVISTSDWLMSEYLRIESRFLVNLNEKHMRKHREAAGNSDSQWFDEDLQLAYYMVEENSPVAGKSLKTLDFRQNYGCNVLQLSNPHRTVDMPGAEQIVTSNDTLLVIGTAAQLQIFDGAVKQRKLGVQQLQPPQSLRQFMLASHMQKPEQQFLSLAITIDKHSPLLGTSMKDAQLRNKWSCLVIGLERGAFTITNPHVSLTFEENDLLWILGKQKMMNTLIREEIL